MMKNSLQKIGYIFLMLAVFLMFSAPSGYARATEDRTPLSLDVNQGHLIPLNVPVSEVLVTNPSIADIQITASNGLFVFGKAPGRTHVMALGAGGAILYDQSVTVTRDLVTLSKLLSEQFPKSNLSVQSSPGRILLSGMARTPMQAEQITSVVRGFLGEGEEIVNRMELLAPSQVNIRVRIVEMNREATKNLGINWDVLLNPGSLAIGLITNRWPSAIGNALIPSSAISGVGGSGLLGYRGSQGSVSAVIDALAEENLITVLAEPNLTSRSGETASFFAGGEFPIPVSANEDQVTIEFKKFGVILDITPTVLSDQRIGIHIRPEVSEISEVGAVVVNDFQIPGIAVRRTEATIELGSGQSFAVAGLLQNQTRNIVNEVPWLADLAVLGPLFRSSRYQKMETELVIIATANIVTPRDGSLFASPADKYRPTDLSEKMTTGKLALPTLAPEIPNIKGQDGLTLKGPVGYIY
ncbi:type II and III secretion system protein family protein [Sneathiella sp. HT1-7]|uniref:type II and III secretion system protein family protein n=1 Tax=Sneathiella sp. HT1-7 TaxID=2887192 RepID=UPI001D136E9D|nr:type II and III secretion system protein family protein [Sneathiella sp. HT1-7]MCC3305774.1 type II and III secretion system protein family protein [Sneathiella sp. HT1-7]